MANAKRLKQLSFSMANKAGLLSEVATAISNAKVNINSICAYESENIAYFKLTMDSPAKAKKALAKLKIWATEDDLVAVEMPNKVGQLQKVAKKISDAGLNISYVYGTTGTGRSSICMLKTSDNRTAIREINK